MSVHHNRIIHMLRLIIVSLSIVPCASLVAQTRSGSTCRARLESHASSLQPELERQIRALPPSPMDTLRRLMLLVTAECTDSIAKTLESSGAVVEYRHAPVGYLRVRIADSAVRRVADVAGVDALMITPTFQQFMRPQMEGELIIRSSSPVRDTSIKRPELPLPLAMDNPYTAAVGIGAESFRKKHPTFDGRGVTVGFSEGGGVDVLMPQLQHAYTLAGKRTRKISDIVVASDPRARDGGTGWLLMTETVSTTGTTAEYGGISYTLPSPGTYRIAQFDERSTWTLDSYRKDVDLDGNPEGSSGIFGVLWNEKTGTVWVDTNRDASFADEIGLRDYSKKGAVGRFRPRQRVPGYDQVMGFAIKIDDLNKAVNIVTGGSHTAMSTTSAVGSNYFGGEAGGVAPGATMVATRASSNLPTDLSTAIYPWVEELFRTAAHPDVDVMMVYLGIPPFVLNDGQSLIQMLERRVVEVYKKPYAVAGNNNGPGIGSSLTSGHEDVLTAGAYSARETWETNFGIKVQGEGELHAFSGRGPAHDGGPGVRLISPIGYLAGEVSFTAPGKKNLPGETPYVLPKGYARGGGTSQATPTISGALALLISAAKQESITYSPRRLAVAMITSARPIPGHGAHEQGAGLFNVERAWDILRSMREEPVRIEAEAPVKTPWSDSLRTPGRGRGLYELEGWKVGDSGTRTITLRRMTGPATPQEYKLTWTCNDGTYDLPRSVISLPLNTPLTIDVSIHPTTTGPHGAFLNVVDAKTNAIVHQVLHTIVIPETLTTENNFRLQHTARLSILPSTSHFVRVPSGGGSLRATLRSSGRPVDLGVTTPARNLRIAGAPSTTGKCAETSLGGDKVELVCTVSAPSPGVWQIFIEYPGGFDPSVHSDPRGIDYELTIEMVRTAQ
jgi:hypothetical protein